MDYNKYYVYKEMVTYDSGQSWEYTGNETPSGDPIGTYDTLEECETSTGHTPTGYDCKLYVEYYTDDSHSATTSYTIPCDDSTTLTFKEVYDALIDISHQFGDYPFIDSKLIVVGDCVETLNLYADPEYGPYATGAFKLGQNELIISPTVTRIYNLETIMYGHYSTSIIWEVGKLTLYNTVREFLNCFVYIGEELHLEKGFLDNNILGLRFNSVFGFGGGDSSRPKVYLSETLPRFFPTTTALSGTTFLVPDDSVGYYASAHPYHDFIVSGQTGGGESYQGVVGAIGTTEDGDTVEYYLNKYGVLGGTIRSDIVRFNVVSPTKAIRNLKISDNYKLSAFTVANSVKVIEDLKVDGNPSTGSTVLGNVSLPDGLWWMREVFDAPSSGVYMVDWKNILPLPSGLYLYWNCFRGDQCPGIDYNIDTLVIPDNCRYAGEITNYPWAQIDTISVGNRVESLLDAKANHFIFGQNLKITNCSASGVTNVYPDSLEMFNGTSYYGGTYNRDFSFGTGIRFVYIGSYFNNKVYFKNLTPPGFRPATTNDNVTFYVPSGSAERYFEATHGLTSAFNPTIIEY